MFVDEGFFDFVNNNEDNTKNMNYDDNNITTTTTANRRDCPVWRYASGLIVQKLIYCAVMKPHSRSIIFSKQNKMHKLKLMSASLCVLINLSSKYVTYNNINNE